MPDKAQALESAVREGDREAVLGILRNLEPAQREALRAAVVRLAKRIEKAVTWLSANRGQQEPDGWGTGEQTHAVQAAVVVCGTARDVAEFTSSGTDIRSLAKEFTPASLRGLGEALLESRPNRIYEVQELIVAGLIDRPQGETYARGLLTLWPEAHAHRYRPSVEKLMELDPGLKDALPLMMEFEGDGDLSLAAVDKYRAPAAQWALLLHSMCEHGTYSRAFLIDKTLDALERGWPAFRSGWFSAFHEMLAPSAEELAQRSPRYLGLLGSRISPTVKLALGVVKLLDQAAPIDERVLLSALRPVFTSAVKAQVEAALRLLDRAIKRAPALATEAAASIVPALAHGSADVQEQVLMKLARWNPDTATRALLADYSPGIAAVNRDAIRALAGAPVAAPAPESKPAIAAPAPCARDPLDSSLRVAPIETLDELVEGVAYVFENDTDIDEFERALAALVRFSPLTGEARERLTPLMKRVPRVKKPVSGELALFLRFLMTGERVEPGIHWRIENLSYAHRELYFRCVELMDFVMRSPGCVPLATPTHRRGFIDPAVLMKRLADYQVRGLKPGVRDGCQAILRLALTANPEVMQALRALDGNVFEAADACIRAAGKRDALSTRFGWRIVAPTDLWPLPGVDVGLNSQIVIADRAGAHRVMAERAEGRSCVQHNVGGRDEGCILYYASMLPDDMEGFFASGVVAFAENIGWWEARWYDRAYLKQLLHPDLILGPMATLLIAIALAVKEPGQSAMAVDALVQARAEGRIDVSLLARDVRALLAGGVTTCARYAKSLQAALRIDVAMGPALIEVLGSAIAARPEEAPKDTSALLELLLEVALAQGRTLPAETRNVLEVMKISGKGAALRGKLLRLP